MTSPLGGVGNCPNLSGCLSLNPNPNPNPQPGRASGSAERVGLRYRKWLWWLKPIEGERENGRGNPELAAAAARRPPAVRLPLSWAPRVARCLQQPSIRWALVWESQLPLGPERGLGRGEERAGTRRGGGGAGGSGRRERKSGVCVLGGAGGGDYVSSTQRVCLLFIFFLIKICHESHYTDLPEERRKRVGIEGGRLSEVNLEIPLIEGL